MWIRIRAVIIEDEPLSAQYLAALLEHAAVNLQAIEHVIHYGDRLYRVQLRDRGSTEITASRTGAARLAAVLRTQR